MNRPVAPALPLLLIAVALVGGFPPPAAAAPKTPPPRTIEAVIRSIDAARGLLSVETPGGERTAFALDETDTIIFSGIRALGVDELSEGMRVEIDSRDASGGEPPRASWIEVHEDAARGGGAGAAAPASKTVR
jgi:hypothetical protein